MMTETIPSEYLCPISMEIMKDPVVLCEDGHTYDRAQLEKWLKDHDTSPITNLKLESRAFITNYALKSLINNFKFTENSFYSFNIKLGAPQNPAWKQLPRLALQLCVIGESGVGKTSFISAVEYGSLPTTLKDPIPTIGCECKHFYLDRLFRDKYVVTIRIDDTAGQEIYRAIAPIYIRSANGILFVVNATRIETLTALQTFWCKQVQDIKGDKYESVLICNWLDVFENCDNSYRASFLTQATELATKHQMSLFSTSAHRGDNVQKSIKNILLRILENEALIEQLLHSGTNKSPKLKKIEKRSGCC